MAVRSRLSTMMMRVKQVIISSTAGRNARLLSSSRVCSLIDHCWPPPAVGSLVMPGIVAWPQARSGSAQISASASQGRARRSVPGDQSVLIVVSLGRRAGWLSTPGRNGRRSRLPD